MGQRRGSKKGWDTSIVFGHVAFHSNLFNIWWRARERLGGRGTD